MEENFKILVLFYSLTGQTVKLARYVAEGAREIEGATVEIKQVPELMPKAEIENNPKLNAAKSGMANIPVATVDDLMNADGIAFGTPVHFGSFASQMKQLIDQLSPAFVKGSMISKPAACFVSSGSTHGGEEIALFSLMSPLMNLGMIPIGIPYPIAGEGPDFDSGSPYGAIFVSGHNKDGLNEGDIKVAKLLGKRLAAMTKVIKDGCKHYPDCHFLLTQEQS